MVERAPWSGTAPRAVTETAGGRGPVPCPGVVAARAASLYKAARASCGVPPMRALPLILALALTGVLLAVVPAGSQTGAGPSTGSSSATRDKYNGTTTSTTQKNSTTASPSTTASSAFVLPPGGSSTTTAAKTNTSTRTAERSSSLAKTSEAAPDSFKAGEIRRTDGDVKGVYVSLLLDPGTCLVRDVRVRGVLVFASVQVGAKAACEASDASRDGAGARYRIENGDASLLVHDHPNGLLRFEGGSAGVRFTLAEGITGTRNAQAVLLSGADVQGILVVNGGAPSAVDGVVVVQGHGGAAVFEPQQAGAAAAPMFDDRTLEDAFAQGKVGGRIDILRKDDGSTEPAAIALDDVRIQAEPIAKDHVRVRVEASLPQGKLFVTTFPPEAFPDGKLQVLFYDVDAAGRETPAKILRAATVEEVANSPVSAYTVVVTAASLQVVVNVPHWSTHIFEVLHVPNEAAPILLYGVVIGVLFATTGAFGVALGWRARRRQARAHAPRRR